MELEHDLTLIGASYIRIRGNTAPDFYEVFHDVEYYDVDEATTCNDNFGTELIGGILGCDICKLSYTNNKYAYSPISNKVQWASEKY